LAVAKALVQKDYTALINKFEQEGDEQLIEVNQKRRAYAEEVIKFALMIRRWRDEAVAIDQGEEGSCYKAVDSWFRDWTAKNLGDKYQVYHWNTIARASEVLSAPSVLPHLPNTKMALFHLAKSAEGDYETDRQKFESWIEDGVLTSDITVSKAKKLGGEGSKKNVSVSSPNAVSKTPDRRRLIEKLQRDAIGIDVPVNALPVRSRDQSVFRNGFAVALLGSEFDVGSGTEVVKIITVLNNETLIERLFSELEE
jgi:hypothetical protein